MAHAFLIHVPSPIEPADLMLYHSLNTPILTNIYPQHSLPNLLNPISPFPNIFSSPNFIPITTFADRYHVIIISGYLSTPMAKPPTNH
jgi:hypothetical protein